MVYITLHIPLWAINYLPLNQTLVSVTLSYFVSVGCSIGSHNIPPKQPNTSPVEPLKQTVIVFIKTGSVSITTIRSNRTWCFQQANLTSRVQRSCVVDISSLSCVWLCHYKHTTAHRCAQNFIASHRGTSGWSAFFTRDMFSRAHERK